MIKYMLPTLMVISFISHAQSKTAPIDSFPKQATVNVTVTSMSGKPRKGEQVQFEGAVTRKIISGTTDATGKLKKLLPPGDTYNVTVKSIADTTRYAVITIPTIGEDEYFTDPYWVKIQYEPARKYRLDNVHFDTDKASLRPDSYTELNELLDYLKNHDEIKIEIAGHTDNVGTAAHNLKLSQDRATTIRNYLVSKGIKSIRLTVKGYGDTQPVADNNTEEGRQLSRRTEVRVL
jgi:outer membrane protein OmpA-like peptidoglycan-associated protein